MTATDFYKDYEADDNLSTLSLELITQIKCYKPRHVFDFGCGTGKHLSVLNAAGICTGGLDISATNILTGFFRHRLPLLSLGNHTHLRHVCNFDVVTTCSVLDHIEKIEGIIGELKRIANKAVVIAETNDVPGKFYYPHDYESLGFIKTAFEWKSNGDGATYHIWKWEKQNEEN
jgi:2-polyprenyl-3-methyl-5-hydroxy-6-metoxy-1,4-benzoquinol methylase